MPDSATPVPATPATTAPAPATAATAGVNLSTTTIVTTLLQAILGAVIAAVALVYAIHSPTEAHIVLAAIGGLAGSIVSGAAVWHLLHLNSTSSSNTLTALEGLLQPLDCTSN